MQKKSIFIFLLIILICLLVYVFLGPFLYHTTQDVGMSPLDAMMIYKTNNDYHDNVFIYYEVINEEEYLLHIPYVHDTLSVRLLDDYYFNYGFYSENHFVLDMTHDEYRLFVQDSFPQYTPEEIDQGIWLQNLSFDEYRAFANRLSARIIDRDPFTEMRVCKNLPRTLNIERIEFYHNFINNCLIERGVNFDVDEYNAFLEELSIEYGYDVTKPVIRPLVDNYDPMPHELDERYIYYSSHYSECRAEYHSQEQAPLEDQLINRINLFIEQGLLEDNCERIR